MGKSSNIYENSYSNCSVILAHESTNKDEYNDSFIYK